VAAFTKVESIWFNGRLVPWDDARVHVLAHGLQYGTGVFEGMRCYATPGGPAVFRLEAHLEAVAGKLPVRRLADPRLARRARVDVGPPRTDERGTAPRAGHRR
jgi:branched-chain amino acid aminotransferase